MFKKLYILKHPLNVVTTGIEALILLGNEFLYACELSYVLYCKTLKELCRVIQNKRCEMLAPGIVLLHDNACLHAAAHT
jgi:hypothetical protein